MKVSTRFIPHTRRSDEWLLVLRTVVEGRIPWRFLPGPDVPERDQENGIWLPHMTELAVPPVLDESEQDPQTETESEHSSATEDGLATSEDADSGVETRPRVIGVQSRFAALNFGDDETHESEGESS